MGKILDSKGDKVKMNSGTSRVTIPQDWARILNLEPHDDCEKAIISGKHGLFFGVWAKDQPNLDDVEDI